MNIEFNKRKVTNRTSSLSCIALKRKRKQGTFDPTSALAFVE
jgi:hypothetical protein